MNDRLSFFCKEKCDGYQCPIKNWCKKYLDNLRSDIKASSECARECAVTYEAFELIDGEAIKDILKWIYTKGYEDAKHGEDYDPRAHF